VAHNWITDQYRRQPPPPLGLPEDLRAEDEAQPEVQTDLHMEQQRVRGALRLLTPDQRQVITLRYFEGWDNEDVAHAMQKPVGAVKALQHRALAALRKWLLDGEKENVETYQLGS
jgi:RNA polymerase sigma-70 factor (ECF subfamily)